MLARNDDVDFSGTLTHSVMDFGKALRQGRQASRKTGRHRSHRYSRSLQCFHRMRHHCRINANSARGDVRIGQTESLEDILPHRTLGLGAKPVDATGRIVAGKRCKIDAGDRLDQPRRLIFFLHRPARRQGRCAPLRSRAVDGDILKPVKCELGPGVPSMRMCQLDFRSFRNNRVLGVHPLPFL